MEMKESDKDHTPGCSAFFVPADIVHAWRRNQRVLELDRPADKQLADKVVSLEQAIEHDVEPPTDKQIIVARRLGEFLTSKKARNVNVDNAFTAPSNMITVGKNRGEIAMSKEERVLSQIPPSYRRKAKKLMDAWSQRGMTWNDSGSIYLKGKLVEGASLPSLLHHASSGRRHSPPTGFGHVIRHMAAEHLPSTVYANPRWRGGTWDNYVPSESSTDHYTDATEGTDDTVTERNVTRDVFPEWQDLSV